MSNTMNPEQLERQMKLFAELGINMSPHLWQTMLMNETISDLCHTPIFPNRNAIRRAMGLELILPEDPMLLSVCHFKSWKHRIENCRLQKISSRITEENFPIPHKEGVEGIEGKLFLFPRYTSRQSAMYKIRDHDRERPWTAGRIEHLLEYASTHHDQQLMLHVVAIGSTIDGERGDPSPYYMPDVRWTQYGHELGLSCWEASGIVNWYYVLAYRKRT